MAIRFLKTFSASVLSSRFFLTSPSNAIDAMTTTDAAPPSHHSQGEREESLGVLQLTILQDQSEI